MTVLDLPNARDRLMATLCGAGVDLLIERILQAGGEPLLFAGAVRDTLLCTAPRDFDIGVTALSIPRLAQLLSDRPLERNRHGGYRFPSEDGRMIDLWRLEETTGLRFLDLPYDLSTVLRTFVLDINAIAFNPRAGSFHDLGSISAIRKHEIGLVDGALIHSHAAFAAKALLMSVRLSWPLSCDLKAFAARFLTPSELVYEAAKHDLVDAALEAAVRVLDLSPDFLSSTGSTP